jgi:hypothetical protein
MPAPKLKPIETDAIVPPPTPYAGGAAVAGSPAHLLQQQLQGGFAAEPHVDRWSPRRALALIVGSSIALWFAIIEGGIQVAHAVA